MKILKYIFLVAVSMLNACNDGKFLEEIPLDFLTDNNSYQAPSDILMTITEMHNITQNEFDGSYTDTKHLKLITGTDVGMGARSKNHHFGGEADINAQSQASTWNHMYQIIKNANLILNVIEDVEFASGAQKQAYIAEARFFRAFAYRSLTNLYGGVPIVLEYINYPKKDYMRASRDEVYQQCVEDLLFATQYLPEADEVEAEGRICNAAAYHLLSEVYICLREWDEAIEAASWVINNPKFELMKERFGRRTDVPETNLWWDLFQKNNTNRSSGNKEAIWVLQFEYDVPGGGALEHRADGNFKYERTYGPNYYTIKDPDGKMAFFGPSTQNGGRPAAYSRPTWHVINTVWEQDGTNDMRNAECNVKRKWIVDNPKSAYYGMDVKDLKVKNDTLRDYWPYFMKVTTPGDHELASIKNVETGEMLSSAGGTQKDWYIMRLSETYLLRAEAYLGNGDKINAANDINAVRTRANATPCNPDEVDIDYILDERIRELLFEEPRRMTLNRLGLLYDRVKRYNPHTKDVVKEYWNLLPIPYSEIERNTDAVLEQNPGYIN